MLAKWRKICKTKKCKYKGKEKNPIPYLKVFLLHTLCKLLQSIFTYENALTARTTSKKIKTEELSPHLEKQTIQVLNVISNKLLTRILPQLQY